MRSSRGHRLGMQLWPEPLAGRGRRSGFDAHVLELCFPERRLSCFLKMRPLSGRRCPAKSQDINRILAVYLENCVGSIAFCGVLGNTTALSLFQASAWVQKSTWAVQNWASDGHRSIKSWSFKGSVRSIFVIPRRFSPVGNLLV